MFHAQVASEAGTFTFPDVVRAVSEKMVRRHPEMFARQGGEMSSVSDVTDARKRIKASERAVGNAPTRVLSDVPLALPGLTWALKLQKKASQVGFDWGDAQLVLAKIREELEEIAGAFEEAADRRDHAVSGEIGDLLFAVVNLARHAGIDPEAAVRSTNAKFERRFAFIEDRLALCGSTPVDSSLEEMDRLWDEAKATGL